jgi:hypothetical protein
MSLILTPTGLQKAKNLLKPIRGKSTIYNLVLSKEKGWHHRSVMAEVTRTRTDAQRISHIQEMPHLNATSKSQACNKQDPFSLLSTNLVRQQ